MRLPSTGESCLDTWIQWHVKYGTLPKTRKGYYQTASLIIRTFRTLGRSDLPHKWTADDVLAIRRHWQDSGLSVKTQKGYDFVLCAFATYFHNNLSAKTKTRWPHDPRKNADWLTLDQIKAVLSTPMHPLEDICIHLMLCMGLRRVEVIRLRVEDIHADAPRPHIIVDGKGHKHRMVPFNWSTPIVLSRYLTYRSELSVQATRKAKHNNRRPFDSGHLIVYQRDGKLSPYSELHPNGFDAAVTNAVSNRCSIKFSAHTLRRSFARELYYRDDGIDIVTLSMILGHERPDETLAYIGPDHRRMADWMIKTSY